MPTARFLTKVWDTKLTGMGGGLGLGLGVVPMWGGETESPSEQVTWEPLTEPPDRQTQLKILPFCNFVGGR